MTFAVVAPLYGMYQIQVGQIEKKQYKIPRLFSLLVRYIAVPALVVYFAILYAYSIQVLTHFSDWPKGMISYLVIGFTLFGYATYIFTRPYEEGMTGTFRKYFPYAVIPQAGMLLYAIYLRIAQYGLTPNRYIVVLFGLLLLGLSLYYIFSQSKKLIFIPLSFAVTAFLFSIGPWSVKFFPLVYNHYIPHTGIME